MRCHALLQRAESTALQATRMRDPQRPLDPCRSLGKVTKQFVTLHSTLAATMAKPDKTDRQDKPEHFFKILKCGG